jgi:hypothetical protein
MNNAIAVPFLSNPNAAEDTFEITSTAYTVSNNDLGKTLIFNKATIQTVTLPKNLQKGFSCKVVRIGAGQVLLAAGSGATVNSGGSLNVPRYTPISVVSYTASAFHVGGADSPAVQSTAVTIATTSNTESYIVAPSAGFLESAIFSSVGSLAAHDTNFITFTITNLGLAGAGSAVMLAASDANTTKATGGTALTAVASRTLTLSSTLADLAVVKGDVLRIRYAADGTLAGTVAGAIVSATFTR